MTSLKSIRFFVVITFLITFIFLSDLIKTELIDRKHRPLFNVISVGIFLLALVVDNFFREKKGYTPNYKAMFYYSIALLFLYICYTQKIFTV